MRTLGGIIGAVIFCAIGLYVHPQPSPIDVLFPLGGAWFGAGVGHAMAS